MKKVLSLVFAIMLIEQVWAEDNYSFSAECDNGQILYYTITSNIEPYTVMITHPSTYGGTYAYYGYTKPNGEIIIPATVSYSGINYQVTSIGQSAFRKCDRLTSISIPNSVTSICQDAFNGCDYLAAIKIPNTINSIEASSFDGCSRLQYNEYDNALYLGNDENLYVALIKAKSTDVKSCEINSSCIVMAPYVFKE